MTASKGDSRADIAAALDDFGNRLAAGECSAVMRVLLADAQTSLAALGHLDAARAVGISGSRLLTEDGPKPYASMDEGSRPTPEQLASVNFGHDMASIRDVVRMLRVAAAPWYESKS